MKKGGINNQIERKWIIPFLALNPNLYLWIENTTKAGYIAAK